MKKIAFSKDFYKKLKNISRKDKQVYNKIHKQLLIFETNPKHPSLRLHKLKGELKNTWSISITSSFRLILIEDHEYYFFDLGQHDEIYKLK